MLHLSVPVLAHSTAVCPTSPKHYTHTSILLISNQAVTTNPNHNFSPQDKQIFHSIYHDILSITQRIQSTFPVDPSLALHELNELNQHISKIIE